jgi:hypothetical protein
MVLMLIVLGPLQRSVAVGLEPARTRQQQAAGAVAPRAREAGQQRDQARGVAAAVHALHAVVQADGSGLQGAEVTRQAADFLGRDAADRRGALGRPLGRAPRQRLEAVDVALDIVAVDPAVRDQLVHHAQRQRAVCAGQQRDVLLALLCGFAAARVDRDQLRAAALGLLRQRPEVQVAGDRVAAPDHDQPALGEEARVHADLGAIGRHQRIAAGRRADGAVQQRGAELVEEALRHRLALHQAHRAGVAVRNDRLRLARRDRLQALRDVGQRLVPRHAHELAAPFRPDPLQRMQHALVVVGALGIAADLGAERTGGVGVLRVALDAHHPTVLDGDAQGAGVRAVVGAGGVNRSHPAQSFSSGHE